MTVAVLKGGASECWNTSVFSFLIDIDINSGACYEQGGGCSVTATLADPSGILLYVSHRRDRNRVLITATTLGLKYFSYSPICSHPGYAAKLSYLCLEPDEPCGLNSLSPPTSLSQNPAAPADSSLSATGFISVNAHDSFRSRISFCISPCSG